MQNLREAWFIKDQGGVKKYVDIGQTQSGEGSTTKVGVLPDVVIGDFVEVMKGSKIENETESEAVEMVSGTLPGLNPSVPGAEKATGSLVLPILAVKTGTAGVILSALPKVMSILCGFDITLAATGHTGIYTLKPGQWATAGLILKCSGPRPDGACIQEVFYNLLADFDISIPVNKKATITFKLSGASYSEQDAATYTPFTSGSAPTSLVYPKDSSLAPAFKNAVCSIAGVSNYNIISTKITGSSPTNVRTDSSEPNGIGFTEATDRKITTQFKIFADPAAEAITAHPAKAFREGAISALSIAYGTGAGAISFASASHKIKKVTTDDENGAMSWTIDGECLGNDFTMAIGTSVSIPA